jgi:hypothetical protein
MRHVLFAAICLVLLFFPSCAGEPNRTIVKEIRILEDGLELISGRNSAGRIVWMGLRSRTSASSLRLTPSHPVFDEEHLLSNHHGDDFQDPDVMAGLTGSPHYPVRLRSGKPQDVLGLFRLTESPYPLQIFSTTPSASPPIRLLCCSDQRIRRIGSETEWRDFTRYSKTELPFGLSRHGMPSPQWVGLPITSFSSCWSPEDAEVRDLPMMRRVD